MWGSAVAASPLAGVGDSPPGLLVGDVLAAPLQLLSQVAGGTVDALALPVPVPGAHSSPPARCIAVAALMPAWSSRRANTLLVMAACPSGAEAASSWSLLSLISSRTP